jgi:dTMP kinase
MPPEELNAFLRWLYDFEFRLMELPKPDAVLYMDIDLKTSIKQLEARQERTHTKGDIHETHVTYLENCLRAGKAAASRLGWKKIACLKDGKMRDEESIHEDIYKIVKGLL